MCQIDEKTTELSGKTAEADEAGEKENKQARLYRIARYFLFNVCLYLGRKRQNSFANGQKEDAKLTATFVGDMMMGRNVEKVTNLHGSESVFKNVKPYFNVSDFITGNFENPVTNAKDYQEAEKNIHLQTNQESVETLKKLNFSVLNFANNHAMDYGEDGLKDTLNKFSNEDLELVGAGNNLEDAKQHVSYQDVNGVKIATLGFTDVYTKNFTAKKNRGGVLPLSPKIFIPMIAEASKKRISSLSTCTGDKNMTMNRTPDRRIWLKRLRMPEQMSSSALTPCSRTDRSV